MKKIRLINKGLAMLWFVVIIGSLLSFSLISYAAQMKLNNPKNIVGELTVIPQVTTPTNVTGQLLILFADALNFDKLEEANTPIIDGLRQNGVTFTDYRAVLPSYSHVNYVSLATGSTPNMTTVFSNSYEDPVQLRSIFSAAQDAGLKTGLITASQSWPAMFGHVIDNLVVVPGEYHVPEANENVWNKSLTYIPANFSQVQFLGFDDTDSIGHTNGADTPEYIACIEQLDAYIGDILDLYDSMGQLENTTVVLISDHGMYKKGHGGEMDGETHATWILFGKGIQSNINITTRAYTSYVTPTLLALLGLPLGPAMNGKVMYNVITSTTQTKAIYSIQQAEILIQQLNLSIDKMGLLSGKGKQEYHSYVTNLVTDILAAKADYAVNDFANAFTAAQESEAGARASLADLFVQLNKIHLAIRISTTLGFICIWAVLLILVNIHWKKELKPYRIFTKKLVIPEIVGMLSYVLILLVFTRFHYAPYYIESTMGLVMPNLYAIVVGAIVAIFLPWLIVFLMNRKSNTNDSSFKDWKIDFLKSSVGSLILITLLGAGFAVYYINRFGPWPTWIIPFTGEYFAAMMFGLAATAIALFGILTLIALIITEYKMEKLSKLAKKADKVLKE